MRKRLLQAIAASALLAMLLMTPALALEPGAASTKADWLNFRAAPDMSGEVLGVAPEGSEVEILEDLGEWCRVLWDGQEGYMSARYLAQTPAPIQPSETEQEIHADAEPEPEEPADAEPEPEEPADAEPEPEEPADAEPEPEEPADAEPEPAEPADAEPEPEEPADAEPEPEEPADDEAAYPRAGVLTGDAVRFRAGAGLDADVYGYLYTGDRVTVLGQDGEWYKVEYGGRTGYLFSAYVRILEEIDPAKAGELAAAIIQTAKDNLGVRYVYGGTTPNGFDCSGLVYYCFVKSGISMQRTASAQYTQGVFVEKADLIPGDLVFFVSPGTWSIGHVGIYIGDGEFIHASSGSGRIMTNRLSDSYYTVNYYGARRILS